MRLSTAAHRGLRAREAAQEAVGHAWTRARDRRLAPPDAVWTTLGGRALAARRVTSFVGSKAIDATLAEVTAALTMAGVMHEVAATYPPTVAVPSASWPVVIAALKPLDLHAQQANGPTPLTRLRPQPGAIRVFRTWASPSGSYLAGADVGIDLVRGEAPASVPALGDIDAVFTWVDGADPAWQDRKRQRLQTLTHESLHEAAANDARFTQIDELRYALRAVARYAPWIRRIHLVTDGQSPRWLADEFPHVSLVRHEEIFSDPTALPTFNSHAIESRLHHIPGLAERYLYFNDDFLLGRYAQPTDYFTTDGRPRVFLTKESVPGGAATLEDQPVVAAAKNNAEVLAATTGTRATFKLKHAPYATLRSVACELEALAAERFRETQCSPFRAPSDLSVASSLLAYYALATGRAVKGEISHFYADIASEELTWRLPRLLEHRDAAVICLNATFDVPAAAARRVSAWAGRYFPLLAT
ncbi:MAG: Stealth CR1 domain-containing protein [Tessaracoccus sp.]|uniref:Stealth CR1 domain-containing protein n=1 Tax=Tessaracoccus sp. TaxID=1971211 RepID=UPI001EB44466|nr:Stealth CR1 domain-containing protein [Tessaracoccus sp.]MBK7820149.1 Stealth CR1 domain-containing protein [Tessaracoccus sp.]